ncbi:hypothetical protein D046_8478, partial [Vibrio parahaemolyticus V-223/04]|jgi:hypothetical protein
MLTR